MCPEFMDIILQTIDDQPVININIFKRQKHVDLQFEPDTFVFEDLDGKELFEDMQHQGRWRIKVKQANSKPYIYYLILKESDKRSSLEEDLKCMRHDVSIEHVGGNIILNGRRVTANDKYLLIAGPFSSEREARHESKNYVQLNHCHIYKKATDNPKGVLEIFDPHYEIFTEVKGGLRLVPKKEGAYFKIKRYAIYYHGNNKIEHKDISYQGVLRIGIDEESTQFGINEIKMEDYLKGVLNSELDGNTHPEYIKSLAIAARSQIFARIGQRHVHEGFDFCSDSHCLRYYGINEKNEFIDRSLAETKGVILCSGKQVCNAYFSYSCGGHTENASGIWLNDGSDYIKGKPDSIARDNESFNLQTEKDIRRWILSRPDVLCKTDAHAQGADLQLSSDAFRWEVFYTRNELEEIIYEKTGERLGLIYELIPAKRGVSGRMMEIEILSSLKNITIKGEMNIRSAFSNNLLNSSCFIIEPELDMDGVPISFTFIGAGKGHGVGLCKVGAAKLAHREHSYKEILAHYFERCNLKEIY